MCLYCTDRCEALCYMYWKLLHKQNWQAPSCLPVDIWLSGCRYHRHWPESSYNAVWAWAFSGPIDPPLPPGCRPICTHAHAHARTHNNTHPPSNYARVKTICKLRYFFHIKTSPLHNYPSWHEWTGAHSCRSTTRQRLNKCWNYANLVISYECITQPPFQIG